MIERLYKETRYSLENSYFKRKYSRLPSKIYYDKKYKTYITPKLIEERGCSIYVCAEIAKTGLIYHFNLNEERNHAHVIDEVLLEAYNHSEQFSIDEQYEAEYSKQELTFIYKMVEQGKNDRITAK